MTAWESASVVVDGAEIAYRCRGEGTPIVFVHGICVSGSLWDGVAERLDGFDASCRPSRWVATSPRLVPIYRSMPPHDGFPGCSRHSICTT